MGSQLPPVKTASLSQNQVNTVAALENIVTPISGMLSSAWVSGCAITPNIDTDKFDVSSGVVLIVDAITDKANPYVKVVNFPGAVGVRPDNINSQFITSLAIDLNAGLVQQNTPFAFSQVRDVAVIGSVGHPNLASITQINEFTSTLNINLANSLDDLGFVLGSINVGGGNIISPNGDNLSLDLSAGSTFRLGIMSKGQSNKPNIIDGGPKTAFPFFHAWRGAVEGTYDIIQATSLRPGRYDDGTGGVITNPIDGQPNGTVGNNEFTISRVYVERSSDIQAIQYGVAKYPTMADAEASIYSEPFSPSPQLEGFLLREYVIVKGNATDLSDPAQAKFIAAGKFGDSVSSAATSSTATMQSTYDNSTDPELRTGANGPVTLQEGNGDDTNNVLEIANNAGQVGFSIDGNGNVGVGTENPAVPLHVVGEIRAYPSIGDALIRLGINGVEKAKIAANNTGGFYIETSGAVRFDISSSGKVTFYDGMSTPNLPTFNDDLSAASLTAGDWYKTPTGELRIKL